MTAISAASSSAPCLLDAVDLSVLGPVAGSKIPVMRSMVASQMKNSTKLTEAAHRGIEGEMSHVAPAQPKASRALTSCPSETRLWAASVCLTMRMFYTSS